MKNINTTTEFEELFCLGDYNFTYQDKYITKLVKADRSLGTLRVMLEDGSEQVVFAHQVIVETLLETLEKQRKLEIENGSIKLVYKRCPGECGGRERRFELDANKYRRFEEGLKAELLWPEMDKIDLATLRYGFCRECLIRLSGEVLGCVSIYEMVSRKI